MSYFVEIPNYQDLQPAKIHEVEVGLMCDSVNPDFVRIEIEFENGLKSEVHPSRVYETLEAAEASKDAYDKQEIERCQRFLAALGRSEK